MSIFINLVLFTDFIKIIRYRIAGNFRWVLIFAISRTVYGVAKIKTAIIYSNRNTNVGSFEIAKIKIAEIILHTLTFKIAKIFVQENFPLYGIDKKVGSVLVRRNPYNNRKILGNVR